MPGSSARTSTPISPGSTKSGALGLSRAQGLPRACTRAPSIDPLSPSAKDAFDEGEPDVAAPLLLALVDHSKAKVPLTCGETAIAKLCLFVVSDTHPVSVEQGSATVRKYEDRRAVD